MTRTALAFAALLWSSPAAHANGPSSTAPAAAAEQPRPRSSPGKPRAPVKAEGEVSGDRAHLRVTFQASATDVRIRVYGVGGLEVTSDAEPLSRDSFDKGDSAELDVSFSRPAEGRSHLALSVSGNFGGVKRSAVASFAVGAPSETQKRESGGGVKRTPQGERIKGLPAEER